MKAEEYTAIKNWKVRERKTMAKNICKTCGQPIHKSKVPGWGWLHSIVGNHDHLAVLKRKEVSNE